MAIAKAIYRLNAFPFKIPKSFFPRNRKINPKIPRAAQNTQEDPEQRAVLAVITVTYFE
jgi:hypothetical protein